MLVFVRVSPGLSPVNRHQAFAVGVGDRQMASGCYLSLPFTNDNFDSSFVFHSFIPAGTSRILTGDTYMEFC